MEKKEGKLARFRSDAEEKLKMVAKEAAGLTAELAVGMEARDEERAKGKTGARALDKTSRFLEEQHLRELAEHREQLARTDPAEIQKVWEE